jgi:predicted membrane channel-forming protein YqfA (hemolysin III family)
MNTVIRTLSTSPSTLLFVGGIALIPGVVTFRSRFPQHITTAKASADTDVWLGYKLPPSVTRPQYTHISR